MTDVLRSSASDGMTPLSCPACKSSSIVTTAKFPDRESYWRCTQCGEVWNASRLYPRRSAVNRW